MSRPATPPRLTVVRSRGGWRGAARSAIMRGSASVRAPRREVAGVTNSPARPARAAAIALVLATAGLAAGCGSSPAASTAIPSEEAPTSVVTPVPTAAGLEGDVVLTAENIAFAETEVAAPADRPFSIALVNKDAGIPHGVEILDADGRSVFQSEITTGPIATSFDAPALEAGTYTFRCPVHPNMTGTLAVGG